MTKYYLVLFSALFCFNCAHSQNEKEGVSKGNNDVTTRFFQDTIPKGASFKAEISTTGIFSTQNAIPFWLRANTNTELGEFTNFSGAISGNYTYKFNKSALSIGAYVFARDGVNNNIQRRDLFVKFENKWLKAIIGSEKRPELLNGLSSTNQNFLWSNNARPLPGLLLESNSPFKVIDGVHIDWGVGHYYFTDNRFVEDTQLHYKRAGLIIDFKGKNKISARIQHYAQWGGTSPVNGELRNGLDAYWNVFIANRATELGQEGEQLNAVGNHLGSYYLEYERKLSIGKIVVYHDHPFEDGSGTAFKNFPDGLYGIFYDTGKNSVISSILYEYTDTRNQSSISSGGVVRSDNYFRNTIYRSGWSFEQNIIGSPFFILDKSIDVELGNINITGTAFQAHHLGFAGSHKKISYKVRLSYSKNLGLASRTFETPRTFIYSAFNAMYDLDKWGKISLLVGVDASNTFDTLLGTGISYKISL